jgi:hypothetical protein
VGLGASLEPPLGDFFTICARAVSDVPECFVLLPDEVRQLAHSDVNKEGRISYWLESRDYAVADYREAWDRIGSGLSVVDGGPRP